MLPRKAGRKACLEFQGVWVRGRYNLFQLISRHDCPVLLVRGVRVILAWKSEDEPRSRMWSANGRNKRRPSDSENTAKSKSGQGTEHTVFAPARASGPPFKAPAPFRAPTPPGPPSTLPDPPPSPSAKCTQVTFPCILALYCQPSAVPCIGPVPYHAVSSPLVGFVIKLMPFSGLMMPISCLKWGP